MSRSINPLFRINLYISSALWGSGSELLSAEDEMRLFFSNFNFQVVRLLTSNNFSALLFHVFQESWLLF